MIRYEVINNSLRIINNLDFGEAPDHAQLNIVNGGEIKGLLPISVCQDQNLISLECTVSGLFPLSQILSGPINRIMFVDLLSKAAAVAESCEAKSLNNAFLDLAPEKIFIDVSNGDLYCIYWPIANGMAVNSPFGFFNTFANIVIPDQSEDISYIAKYREYMMNFPLSRKSP